MCQVYVGTSARRLEYRPSSDSTSRIDFVWAHLSGGRIWGEKGHLDLSTADDTCPVDILNTSSEDDKPSLVSTSHLQKIVSKNRTRINCGSTRPSSFWQVPKALVTFPRASSLIRVEMHSLRKQADNFPACSTSNEKGGGEGVICVHHALGPCRSDPARRKRVWLSTV